VLDGVPEEVLEELREEAGVGQQRRVRVHPQCRVTRLDLCPGVAGDSLEADSFDGDLVEPAREQEPVLEDVVHASQRVGYRRRLFGDGLGPRARVVCQVVGPSEPDVQRVAQVVAEDVRHRRERLVSGLDAQFSLPALGDVDVHDQSPWLVAGQGSDAQQEPAPLLWRQGYSRENSSRSPASTVRMPAAAAPAVSSSAPSQSVR